MTKYNFKNTSDTRMKFILDMVNDIDLCKSLISDRRDFLDVEITEDQRFELIDKQIFPTPKVTETVSEAKSFITMYFEDLPSKTNPLIKNVILLFSVVCKSDLLYTDYGFLRYDFISNKIADIMQDKTSTGNWLGKLKYGGGKDKIFDEKGQYLGRQLLYKSEELI